MPAAFRDAGEYQRTFTRAMVEESCLLLQELARKLGRVLDAVGADGDLQRRHYPQLEKAAKRQGLRLHANCHLSMAVESSIHKLQLQ